MLQRFLICGLLLYLAAAIEMGLPTWVSTPVVPSALSLLFLLFCQSLRGGELVAWAGAIGLYQDYATGMTPGVGIMTTATLALVITARQINVVSEKSFMDRLFSGLWLLLVLGAVRGIRIVCAVEQVEIAPLASALLARAAATFLLFVLISSLWSGYRFFSRRSYRLENSCV